MIIGISGKIGSGKDTAAKIFQSLYQNLEDSKMGEPTWMIKKFADKLKERIALTWNIDRRKLEDQDFKTQIVPSLGITWRKLMQLEGEKMREIDIDYWVKARMVDYSPSKNWLITDLRYPNEAEAIKKAGGYLLRLERSWLPPIKGDDGTTVYLKRFPLFESQHSSETALDDYKEFDFIVQNEGTIRDLEEKLKSLKLV